MRLRIDGRKFEAVVGQRLRIVVGQPADIGRADRLPRFQILAGFEPDFGVVVRRFRWRRESQRRDLLAIGRC